MKESYYSRSINPHKLYRDPDKGIIFGVCAGIGDYLGVKRGLVRLIFVILFFISLPICLIAYLILAWGLTRKPEQLYASTDEEEFWRSVSFSPKDTLHRVRHHFRAMDDRLKKMEDFVTSSEYDLEREYKNL